MGHGKNEQLEEITTEKIKKALRTINMVNTGRDDNIEPEMVK